MTKGRTCWLLASLATLVVAAWAAGDEEGWTSLFNGESLEGWKTIRAGHGTEAIWEVIEGAIVGRQNPPGKGGVLATERTFGDFEVVCEVNPQWPMDSGLFLRAQPGGKCYQITIDYRPGGQVGTLYGEGIGGWLQKNEAWKDHYRRDEWNELRARVVGNPPKIEAWLNGEKLVDYQDDQERLPAEGHIALQVHRGEKYKETVTRFRNIRIKPLD